MEAENLMTFLNSLVPFGPSLDAAIRERLNVTRFKKGDILASPGRRADEIWFIVSGLAKEFHTDVFGNEVVTTFWRENELMLVTDSFFRKIPSDRFIKLIEDSALLNLESKKAHELLKLYPELRTLEYLIYSAAKKKTEERGELMFLSGAERYRYFCRKFPYGRISVADAASYLGLTRSALSKIRGKII